MPEGSRRKHRHHYLPVFHLRHFADADGAVWTHDRARRLTPNPKPLKPASIAAEEELYTFRDDEGDPSDAIENWLATEIDAPAAPVLARLASGGQLDRSGKSTFARYIMSRDLRTPKARDFLLDVSQRLLEVEWEKDLQTPELIRDRIVAAGGPEYSIEDIEYYARRGRPVVNKEFWLDFMQRHVHGGAPRVFDKGWLVVTAEEGASFVTSDIGIVKHRGDFSNPVPHAPGWWLGAEGWIMPLTPKQALFLAPKLTPGGAVANAQLVERINRDLRTQAYRFVFASSELLAAAT